MTFKNGILSLACVLFVGCASSSSQRAIDIANKDLLNSFNPYILVKTDETKYVIIYQSMPAGDVRPSLAPIGSALVVDVFKEINKVCNFKYSDLKETRMVYFDDKTSFSYEVWVFNDPLSQRDDKITAITVLLKPTPDIGGTDMDFRIPADCHDEKPMTFVFGK
ncbi:MAG: hypothetical protein HXK56_05555 [Campylobacter concisus]|nr:hypothetical protein [Campylobacter concisus]